MWYSRGLQSQKARFLPMGFQGLGYPLLEPGVSGLLAQLASQAVQTSSCFSCFVRAHRALTNTRKAASCLCLCHSSPKGFPSVPDLSVRLEALEALEAVAGRKDQAE